MTATTRSPAGMRVLSIVPWYRFNLLWPRIDGESAPHSHTRSATSQCIITPDAKTPVNLTGPNAPSAKEHDFRGFPRRKPAVPVLRV
jgi:hypothetical protein